MRKPTLLILAAGMGSRYGGLKQLDSVGPNGETIMDFTVKDAIDADFGKIVFVIRKDFEKTFDEKIISKYEKLIEIEKVFQEISSAVPETLDISNRQKPWGTGHAVLVAKEAIKTPFAVVNADDFYGKKAIQQLGQFLQHNISEHKYAMVGYPVESTLTPHGKVSRGICQLDDEHNLLAVTETHGIHINDEGNLVSEGNIPVHEGSLASMNLWGLHPSVFDALEKRFALFIKKNYNKDKSEFYLPFVIADQLKNSEIEVKVLRAESKWLGVTFKDDLPNVQEGIGTLISQGIYPSPLW